LENLSTQGNQSPNLAQPSENLSTQGNQPSKREKRYAFRFTGSESLKNKIQRAKEVLSHKHPEGKLEEVFNAALDKLLEAQAPELQKGRKNSQPSNIGSPYIPRKMRRDAFAKANYCCEQRGTSGRRCGSRHQLEVDHVIPRAHGGKTVPENLQVLCKAHNLDKAKNQMGEALIESKMIARRRHGTASQRNFAQTIF
jgi:5-methylcytosine-specific restriction endonuclease McrA